MQSIFQQISKGQLNQYPSLSFFWHTAPDRKFNTAFFHLTCINRKNHVYHTVYGILFYCRFRNLNAVLSDIRKDTGYIIGFCIFCNYFKMMPHIVTESLVHFLGILQSRYLCRKILCILGN